MLWLASSTLLAPELPLTAAVQQVPGNTMLPGLHPRLMPAPGSIFTYGKQPWYQLSNNEVSGCRAGHPQRLTPRGIPQLEVRTPSYVALLGAAPPKGAAVCLGVTAEV